MEPGTIAAISEIAKFGLIAYFSYMKQAGLTNDQIETAFQEAKKAMLARNPADIPAA
jgi:hypothetical protein